MRVTQSQIAEQAGVSQATVSLVLSGKRSASVEPETYERVLAIARELGYHKQGTTKLKGAQTGNIGFIIPQHRSEDVLTVYIRRLYTGVLDQLREHHLHLLQAIAYEEETVPEIVRLGKVDGVIMEDECDDELIRRTQEYVPVVLLNHHSDYVNVDSFMPDNIGGMWQGMKYLYDLGHRHIALYGLEPDHLHHRERLAGYQQSLRTLDLPVRDEYIELYTPDWVHNAQTANEHPLNTLRRWMQFETPPTAVVTLCDSNASFILRAARELGVSVPEQLSVVGFDNSVFCDHTEPRLTSIHQPMEEMGRLACDTLMDHIAGVTRPIQHTRLGVELVTRESATTAPALLPTA